MDPVTIKGEYDTRIIWLNGKELDPEYSLNIYSHSQEGYDWGHTGDGTAQLALAILLELTANKKISIILHHLFKTDFLSNLSKSDFEITVNAGDWFYKNLSAAWDFLEFIS